MNTTRHAIFSTITGDIIGYSSNSQILLPPGQTMVELPEDWQDEWADDALLIDGELVIEPAAKLAQVQGQRKARIKREAATKITALDWRVTRAHERQALSLDGESPAEVFAMREAIRRASSRAEEEVDDMTSVSAVRAFNWAVTEEDQLEIEEL